MSLPPRAAEVNVPPHVAGRLAARIDRLDDVAKQNAERGCGDRHRGLARDLPAELVGEIALTELVQAELIDQVQVHPFC